MTPDQLKRFEEMEKTLKRIQEVLDVPFIESAKFRIVRPVLKDVGVDAVVSKTGTGTTSGITASVDEAGSGSYTVAKVYNGSITISDVNGNLYKLGYYTA